MTDQLPQSFEPQRSRVVIAIGTIVLHQGEAYRIAQVLDYATVIGIHTLTGRSAPLAVADLKPVQPEVAVVREMDLDTIADADWQTAERRYAAIQPLLTEVPLSRKQVEIRAGEVGVDAATLYRWLRRFNAFGVMTALIPRKRGWRYGSTRLSQSTEAVIVEVIRDFYLTSQRPSVQKSVTEVLRRCHKQGVELPSPTTIRDRLAKVDEKDALRGRGQREKAKNKFTPVAGRFPNADYPLAVVQIDHTPVDLILVDDVYRKPIGRPWLTLAIDVYSRMVVGYYLSFDAPSETSVAMCVAHAALPKEEWLLLHEIDAEWPVWGFPRTIHVDNGAEFRSNNFQKSCLMHNISLEFRPVRAPRYGGHIERLLGTFAREIHDLPGTTFSNVEQRDDYDSEKHAVMTKSEFEAWFVTLVCKVYHRRIHSKIGVPPIRQWETGVFGNGAVTGVGLPPRPADRLTVLLDFLPSFSRTVQTFGVTIDGLTYYAEALRMWINAADADNGKKQAFVFRRDPRDISLVWFFDPVIAQYFPIPLADQSLPCLSLWEYKQARDLLRKEGKAAVNMHQIFAALDELRRKVEVSQERSKNARRQAQRRREHAKHINPAQPLPASVESAPLQALSSGLDEGEIEAFGDVA